MNHIATFFEDLDAPVAVIAGLLAIASALIAGIAVCRKHIRDLTRWWQHRPVRQREHANRLVAEARDHTNSDSDKQRLNKLQRAGSLYRSAADSSGHAWAMLHAAYILSNVLSPVRDDRLALKTALDAARISEQRGDWAFAAEAFQLAGDLCSVPIALRNPAQAKMHYAAAARCFRRADLIVEAEALEAQNSASSVVSQRLMPISA